MARSPWADPDTIKTRLAPALPRVEDRQRLYLAFLTDMLSMCRTIAGVRVRVAYAPAVVASGFGRTTPAVVASGLSRTEPLSLADPDELVAQPDGDLGARERGVFDTLFSAGFDRVVMIGSDLPTLPPAHLADAIARLHKGRVVLGPSDDGGYYLMGLEGPQAPRELFDDIRWSTPHALDDTVRGARRAGLEVRLVAPWYDVDEPDDLDRLRRELRGPEAAARAPATAAALAAIDRSAGH